MTGSVAIKRLADVSLGKMVQPEPKSPFDVRGQYLRAAHVQPSGALVDVDDKTMWFSPAEISSHNLIRGDVVVVEGGAGFGRAALIAQDLKGWGFQNSIVRLRPLTGRSDGGYICYALQSALANGATEVACNSATIPHFTADKVGAFQIPAHSLREQRAIADFLDRETARIDTLIAKQEQLITTLRERRRSLIDFSLQSGDQTRLRSVIEFCQTGPFGTQLSASEYVSGGVPIINPTHIRGSRVLPDLDVTVLPEKARELVRFRCREGDLVLGRKGDVDKCALVDGDTHGYICGSDAMLIRPDLRTVTPRYLWWFLQSTGAHSQLEQWSVGSTVAGLNQRTISSIGLPIHSLSKQAEIVASVDEGTANVDALIAKTERFIELSKERRAALITAAVTGQIDVRTA